jgi:ribonuclease PH
MKSVEWTMLVKEKNKKCIKDHRRRSRQNSPIEWGRRDSAKCRGGVMMEFTSTTVYVQVGGPYHKILRRLLLRRNGPRTKIKQTLVIQAGGRRMNMKIQKMTTTTMEENNVQIFYYGTNSSCWMEMKISWTSDRPQRE